MSINSLNRLYYLRARIRLRVYCSVNLLQLYKITYLCQIVRVKLALSQKWHREREKKKKTERKKKKYTRYEKFVPKRSFSSLSFLKNLALKSLRRQRKVDLYTWYRDVVAIVVKRRAMESKLSKEGIFIRQLPNSEPKKGEEGIHLTGRLFGSEPQKHVKELLG